LACTNEACQQLQHHYISSSEAAAQQSSVGLGFIKGFLTIFLAFGLPGHLLPNPTIVVLVTLLVCEPIWYYDQISSTRDKQFHNLAHLCTHTQMYRF
jgi:hypothetical protein